MSTVCEVRLPKGKSCDYCRAAPVAFYRKRFTYSRMGQRRVGFVTHATCAEHESSVSWQANIASGAEVRRA